MKSCVSISYPRSGGPFPLVVVQEIFGVHEHILHVCRRLAKVRCFAVAPEELFVLVSLR